MMSFTDHPLPDPLPERPCWDRDLLVDSVGYGRDYRGHNGTCMNCETEYSESDDSDLSNTHWMHTKKVRLAFWHRDTPADLKAYALIMDPDEPWDATDYAERLLAHGTILMG